MAQLQENKKELQSELRRDYRDIDKKHRDQNIKVKVQYIFILSA
jgi:t-SNARE complex subunit (syntaxin)